MFNPNNAQKLSDILTALNNMNVSHVDITESSLSVKFSILGEHHSYMLYRRDGQLDKGTGNAHYLSFPILELMVHLKNAYHNAYNGSDVSIRTLHTEGHGPRQYQDIKFTDGADNSLELRLNSALDSSYKMRLNDVSPESRLKGLHHELQTFLTILLNAIQE